MTPEPALSSSSDPITIIVQLFGMEVGMVVAQRLGGRDIWLPLQAPLNSRLADIIGPAAALRVAIALGRLRRSPYGAMGVSVLIPGNRRCISEDQARQSFVNGDERAAENLGINETTVARWRLHFTGKERD